MTEGFSIEQFKKPVIDTDFEGSSNELPHWLNQDNPKIVALYHAVINEFETIQERIRSGETLTPRQRQVGQADVCKRVRVDKSYLRKDRPDAGRIIEFIDEKNEVLGELWAKKKSLKRKSGRKLLRSELEKQNQALKSEIAEIRTGLDREYFRQWVDLSLVNDSKRMVAKITDLQIKLDRLEEQNTELKAEVARLRRDKFKSVK